MKCLRHGIQSLCYGRYFGIANSGVALLQLDQSLLLSIDALARSNPDPRRPNCGLDKVYLVVGVDE